ncbi:hypothetical protein NBRC110019_22590 [Neptunitalea chrysea]|uniref:DUF4397 domain-containing protein n=1 Tax=Neptunitalea chrysea TaxID=1647581 RepID=A0A9W6B8B3_9FLAO|nr:hypothetical protein [Neptunitalea chrysea]GLB53219.1 hypothetical protein NBRC110019_22590 [Neptunitalea chrysea]
MKKVLVLIIGVLLSSISCNSDDSGTSRVEIRVHNTSDYTYSNIYMDVATGNKSYGDLEPDGYSDYKVLNLAYNIAYIQLEIDGETYYMQPIDYDSEEPLSGGTYTYDIDASDDTTDAYGRLSLTVVSDDE